MKRLVTLLSAVILCTALFAQAPVQDKYSPSGMQQNYDKREVKIKMRDGIGLYTVIYEPKDKSVKHPILMERSCYGSSPYGEGKYMNFRSYVPYVDAGYIFVFQDVRGKNMSDGEFEEIRPFIENKKLAKKEADNVGFTDEASDTYDTVEWLVNNTNNNGCVGQKGTSYPGFYSTMAALCGHPAMKAVSPQAPVTDWFMGDDAHHNGALMLAETVSFQGWFENIMKNTNVQNGIRNFKTPELMHTDIYTDYLRIGTYKNYTDAYADSLEYLRTLREHPNLDEYWISHTVSKGHLHDVKPAVMVVGGFFDKEDCYGALDVYKTMRQDSPETNLYLVDGPWYHGGWSRGMMPFWKNMYFGDEATSEYYNKNIEYPFFAYYLEGKGEKPQTGARIFDSGARTWTQYDNNGWPEVSVSEGTPFYLHADGTVSTTAPAEKNAKVSYVSDPAKPVPYHSEIETGVTMNYMIADQRFAAQRPDVLCFETPILDEDVKMAGEIEVGLQVDLDTTDADFIVKVIDVFPDDFSWYDELGIDEYAEAENGLRIPNYPMGGYQFMVRGDVMRGKFRESFSDPTPFVPGQTSLVKFRLTDIAHTFKKGHKLMIQVQSSWFPLVDRNPQTFCNIYTCDESAYVKANINIHCEKDAASYVKLPLVK